MTLPLINHLSAVTGLSVSIVMDSEWARSVGIRTDVHEISRFGRSMILRLSHVTCQQHKRTCRRMRVEAHVNANSHEAC